MFIFSLACGQEKGLTPIVSAKNSVGETYAVVVGISDYQDEEIPDLSYADKDAEAFAFFLQSQAGGSLDEDHLKVLLNEEATLAKFAMHLDWLWEVIKENDRVIIYFSGHGDVERKSLTQPGYLLCWDAPSKVYMAGGAFNVRDLNDVVSTLSIQNKAKVILVTDACRSGNLSGSDIGGPQATASILAKQFANEIKILSCQPNEYSIEGKQWGGGRGAFSFHLLDGLTGMADQNKDLIVNLKEIGRYLEDNVTEEVSPHNQNPMIVGSKSEQLTNVFPKLLSQLKEGKKGQMQLFASTKIKGIEDEVLANVDSSIVTLYNKFKKSLTDRQFMKPSEACAEYYYNTLRTEPKLERLYSSMRRNYAAALQDDAQQVLNKLLKSDPSENSKTLISINAQYGTYPENLRRAAELLGKQHYMYNELLARSYWFEGYVKDRSRCSCKNIENARKTIPYYLKALEYQPDMPHAWIQLAALYGTQMHKLDSAEYYAALAIDAVPNWTLVYHWMGNAYLNATAYEGIAKKIDLISPARDWLQRGLEIDSNSVNILNELSYLYNLEGQFRQEQDILDRSFELNPLAMTMFYKGDGLRIWGKYDEAEKSFLEAIAMDSTLFGHPRGLAALYSESGQYEKLDKYINKIVSKGTDQNTLEQLGQWMKLSSPEMALKMFELALEKDPQSEYFLQEAALTGSYCEARDLQQEMQRWEKIAEIKNKPTHEVWSRFLVAFKMKDSFEINRRITEYQDHKPNSKSAAFLVEFQNGNQNEYIRLLEALVEKHGVNAVSYNVVRTYTRYLPDQKTVPIIYKKLIELHPDNSTLHYDLAVYYSYFEKDNEKAYDELENAIAKGFDDYLKVVNEIWLFRLKRDFSKWDAFLKKHFKNKYY